MLVYSGKETAVRDKFDVVSNRSPHAARKYFLEETNLIEGVESGLY